VLQAARHDVFIEDHDHALKIVIALSAVTTTDQAIAAIGHASTFLAPHMAEEEAVDGVFHWIMALEPGLDAEMRRLPEEHEEIRQEVAAALSAEGADAIASAHALARHLELHEAAERAALQRALG
jgi:hypothetical protein